MTSTKRTKESNAYKMDYPSFLPWPSLINVLEEGTCLHKNGVTYRIKQIIRPAIPGSKTRVVLEKADG
jgi:hypothetical protein